MPLEIITYGFKATGQASKVAVMADIEGALDKMWKIADGMLERGGWCLGEGTETGVPMAVPMSWHPAFTGPAAEKLETGGAVGEGAIPDEKPQSPQPKPVTGGKKPVTKKLGKRK